MATYTERLKKTLHQKEHHCDCHKKGRFTRVSHSFDDQAEPYQIVPLEEHFENFGEMAQNFLGLGKKAQARKSERQETRTLKKLAKVDIKKARAEAIRTKSQAKLEEAKRPSLASQQQADQVNQLASQVQPTASAVSPSQTPQGSEGSGGQYATLPEYTPPTSSGLTGMSGGSSATAPSSDGGFGIEPLSTEEEKTPVVTPVVSEEEPKKKSNVVLYLVIVAVVIGAVYMMKKK